MISNMQSQSKGKFEELRTSKKKFNFIPSIPLNVQFTKSPSTSSDRPHVATLKLQKITSYPALGSPLKKFEPASSERNIETSSTPRSLYFDTLKLSTASRLQSKRTRYHHNGLSMGSDKKSEMGISTYGSTTFYSEGVFHVAKKKSEVDQETKRSNQEEVSEKVNKIFRQRKKMEACDLHDEKLNSKLQKLIYYFKNMYTKVVEITQASFDCSIPDMFVELEHTAYSMIQLFMGQTQGLRDAQIKLEKQAESLQKLTKQEVKEEHKKLKTVKLNEIIESIDVHQNARFMEIHRLETQNEYLQSELNKALEILNSECGVEALKGLKSSNQKKLEEYMKLANEKDLLASRFEILYVGMKKTNEKLESLNKEAETKLMQAVAKQKYYQDLCNKMEEEKWMYYERAMMQLADYEGLMTQHESDKEDLNKLRDIFLAEKAKQRKEREEKVKQEIEEEENFSKDTIWIQSAKNLFACSMGPGKQFALRKAKEKEKTTAEIDLRNYMFAKPAYEHLIHTNMALNFQLKNQIDLEFIATLRAIFDSKFNELLYFNDHKKISSFPDFVYSWLGKYIFDKKQRKVRIIDITDPNPEHIRTDIYYLLQTPICKRLWDCVIFKEFLDEIYTRDELTYFIQCRNILFQGPQLHDQSASFAYVYYVRLDSAYRVIDYLLSSKYDSKILAEIKQKVKGRSRMKNKVQLIDSGFLLRILLEEYRTYKKDRFAFIRSILSQEPSVSSDPSKFALGFASFKNFMTSYFPKAYEIEKAELYRKCWVLSNGFVDVDSVLTILNEENMFAREMETRTFELLPSLSYRDNPGKMRTYLLNKYQTITERLEPLKAIAWELGVESITMDLYNYEKDMTNKFAIDGDETNDHGVSLWLYSFMGYIHKVDQINFQINAPEKKMLQKTVETLFPLLEDRIEEACSEQLTKVKVFELNHKAKVLQKFLKAKLSGWYKLMKFLLRKKMMEKYGQPLPNSNEIKTISSLKSLL